MWFLLRLLSNWKVLGKENIPEKGPFLITANHLNNADPPLLAVSISRKIIFMSKEELFRSKLISYFVAGFGSFPVHRGQFNLQVFRHSKQVLDNGWGLVMFPEGKRSDGCLIPAFSGSAAIAVQNNVPLLPIGITGTEKLRGILWILKRPNITVTIGKPFMLYHNRRVTREQLEEMTDEIMCMIAALLPEKYHGCYKEKLWKSKGLT